MSYNCIEFQRVSYVYNKGTPNHISALVNVSLEIKKGEFISIVGASGSGKSTLAKHCNGILFPTEGKVIINGKDTQARKVRINLWQEVGLVLQHPEQQLFEATVYEDVAFGPNNLNMSPREVEICVARALEWVGLDLRQIGQMSPFALSGGEKRRVAIAGILAIYPSILVLDEPLAGLDPLGRKKMLELLVNLHKHREITIILITHNMDDAAKVSDRVFVMEQGGIKFQGEVGEIFSSFPGDLEKMGLEVPFATLLLSRLQQSGYPVQNGYTLEDAASEIIKLYNRGGRCV